MWNGGLADPRLLPSYGAALLSAVLLHASIRRLRSLDREATRPQNRFLHQLKWAGVATCTLVILIKSVVRIWFLASAQGPHFVDTSWWACLWIVFDVAAVWTMGVSAYLWWNDRPFPTGHCQACGYDLRGNVSGRCPECGNEV